MAQATNTTNNCFFGFITEKSEICFLNSKGETQILVVKIDAEQYQVDQSKILPLYQGGFLIDAGQHNIIAPYLKNGEDLLCLEYVGYELPVYFKKHEIAVLV